MEENQPSMVETEELLKTSAAFVASDNVAMIMDASTVTLDRRRALLMLTSMRRRRAALVTIETSIAKGNCESSAFLKSPTGNEACVPAIVKVTSTLYA